MQTESKSNRATNRTTNNKSVIAPPTRPAVPILPRGTGRAPPASGLWVRRARRSSRGSRKGSPKSRTGERSADSGTPRLEVSEGSDDEMVMMTMMILTMMAGSGSDCDDDLCYGDAGRRWWRWRPKAFILRNHDSKPQLPEQMKSPSCRPTFSITVGGMAQWTSHTNSPTSLLIFAWKSFP